MIKAKGWILWLLGIAASVPWNIFLSGLMVAAAAKVGVWSYPLFILVGFVEALLILRLYQPNADDWIARMMARRSRRLLAVGRVGAVLLVGLLFGPLISTAFVKLLEFRGPRALLLAFAATALTRGVGVSLCLGAVEVWKEFLFNVG
ncbi:MAG: hypothetical protein AAB562_00465 [Patescibacteria group bacterium]